LWIISISGGITDCFSPRRQKLQIFTNYNTHHQRNDNQQPIHNSAHLPFAMPAFRFLFVAARPIAAGAGVWQPQAAWKVAQSLFYTELRIAGCTGVQCSCRF
jgi:hypothetical protein